MKIFKNYKFLIIGIFILTIIICFLFYKINSNSFFSSSFDQNKKVNSSITFNNSKIENHDKNKENKSAEISPLKTGKVDIKGYVKNPGVYVIDDFSRVIDIIKKAGGIIKGGDTSLINLSKKVTDEMVIIINSKKELDNNKNIKPVFSECICPICFNDNLTDTNIKINTNTNIDNDNKNLKISLNNATIKELIKLPGIGEKTANKIILYKKENGNFKKLEEILEVPGIGESVFAKIKKNITL